MDAIPQLMTGDKVVVPAKMKTLTEAVAAARNIEPPKVPIQFDGDLKSCPRCGCSLVKWGTGQRCNGCARNY